MHFNENKKLILTLNFVCGKVLLWVFPLFGKKGRFMIICYNVLKEKGKLAKILYSEVNLINIAILLIIVLKKKSGTENSFKNKLFSASVWFAIGANCFDFTWNLCMTNGISVPIGIVMAINFMHFVSFGLSSYFWFLYSEATSKGNIFNNNKALFLSFLPIIMLISLLVLSIFNGCLFYFDKNKTYHRGRLFYLQQILSYGYIVFASLKNFAAAAKNKNFVRRDELLSVATFAVPPLLCGILQIIFHTVPIITVGVMISFLLAYINSLQLMISIDSVTGISNRRVILNHLEEQHASLKKDEKLYFLFIDIDSFKMINDTYGHNEGDKALRIVAEALKEICLDTKGFCARYGGDEFAVVQVLKSDEDITDLKKQIYNYVEDKNNKQRLAYTLSVSIGCAEYTPEAESVLEVISNADENMYNNKMNKKLKS